MNKKIASLLLLLVVAVNIGCAPKKADDNNVGGVNVDGTSVFSMSLLPTRSTAAGAKDISKFDWVATSQANEFYNVLKYLVSANINPASMGTVGISSVSSASNSSSVQSVGVVLRGDVSVGNDNKVQEESYVQLEINDSWVGQLNSEGNTIEAIKIKVPFQDGTLDSKKFHLVFSDQYGSITLDGVFDSGYTTVSGALSFVNSVNVDKSQSPRSGTLGRFFINTCQLFRCL